MRLYYINLDRRTDRRAEMEAKFTRLGLTAERVSAVTPAEITAAQREKYCDPRQRHWMTDVELCCSLSHIKTLERFLSEGSRYAVVLEDDAMLSRRLPAFLEAFQKAQPPIDLLRLETDLNGQRLMPKPESTLAGIEIRRAWSWAAGSAAYVVTRDAARTIVDSHDLLRLQVDGALFNPYTALGRRLVMRHCLPGLAVQDDRLDASRKDSDIAMARAAHAAPRPLPLPTRAWRTVSGIFETEILQGSQRQFHTLFGGARKIPVPFAAE
ncbi:hypothetical protein VW35_12175 [Devosia soli]|uniref:Glycosyl transferase family 25 domain-containing protein n=1 Tax=Devosia soli TaxID=361041 RepID=A0A0F5L808_9HYPH|nr:glycosyltransferase family 25 protein [Devosia soli]KKB78380.1 hypothetical protein VW35_12175 [Devosia soli]